MQMLRWVPASSWALKPAIPKTASVAFATISQFTSPLCFQPFNYLEKEKSRFVLSPICLHPCSPRAIHTSHVPLIHRAWQGFCLEVPSPCTAPQILWWLASPSLLLNLCSNVISLKALPWLSFLKQQPISHLTFCIVLIWLYFFSQHLRQSVMTLFCLSLLESKLLSVSSCLGVLATTVSRMVLSTQQELDSIIQEKRE